MKSTEQRDILNFVFLPFARTLRYTLARIATKEGGQLKGKNHACANGGTDDTKIHLGVTKVPPKIT